MNEKRYAIVRVDNSCPAMLDDFGCIIARNILHCKCGEDTKNYGDTKEQLIRKVAQALFRRKLALYNLIWGGVPSKTEAERYYEICLETAKEIIEFLGVE